MLRGMEFALFGVSILVFIVLMFRLPNRESEKRDSSYSSGQKK
jgi:predicted MFS family arabinose efflux permease